MPAAGPWVGPDALPQLADGPVCRAAVPPSVPTLVVVVAGRRPEGAVAMQMTQCRSEVPLPAPDEPEHGGRLVVPFIAEGTAEMHVRCQAVRLQGQRLLKRLDCFGEFATLGQRRAQIRVGSRGFWVE